MGRQASSGRQVGAGFIADLVVRELRLHRFCDAVQLSIDRISRVNPALFMPPEAKRPRAGGAFSRVSGAQRLDRLDAGLVPRDAVLVMAGRCAPPAAPPVLVLRLARLTWRSCASTDASCSAAVGAAPRCEGSDLRPR